jgi:membrane-associated phospholipid phosphatase
MTDHRTTEEAATALEATTGAVGWIDRVVPRGLPNESPEVARASVPAAPPIEPRRSSRLSNRAATIASTVVAFLLVYVASVWTVAGQRVEDAGMTAAARLGESTHAVWSVVFNTVSYSTLVYGLVVLALFGLRTGGIRRAIAAPSVLGFAIVAAELLKHVILPRPRLYASPKWLWYPSFPSGHTTIAVGIAASALFVAGERTRRAVQIGGFAYAALMGISLIVTANHRLSDEVGSCLLVYLTAYLVSIGLARGSWPPTNRAGSSGRRTTVGLAGGLAAIRVGANLFVTHGRLMVVVGCVVYVVVCAATLHRIGSLVGSARMVTR